MNLPRVLAPMLLRWAICAALLITSASTLSCATIDARGLPTWTCEPSEFRADGSVLGEPTDFITYTVGNPHTYGRTSVAIRGDRRVVVTASGGPDNRRERHYGRLSEDTFDAFRTTLLTTDPRFFEEDRHYRPDHDEHPVVIGLCVTGTETVHVFWDGHDVAPLIHRFNAIATEVSGGRVRW
jgi:hypothetical protein